MKLTPNPIRQRGIPIPDAGAILRPEIACQAICDGSKIRCEAPLQRCRKAHFSEYAFTRLLVRPVQMTKVYGRADTSFRQLSPGD